MTQLSVMPVGGKESHETKVQLMKVGRYQLCQ